MQKHGFRDIGNEKEIVRGLINCLQSICKIRIFYRQKMHEK